MQSFDSRIQEQRRLRWGEIAIIRSESEFDAKILRLSSESSKFPPHESTSTYIEGANRCLGIEHGDFKSTFSFDRIVPPPPL